METQDCHLHRYIAELEQNILYLQEQVDTLSRRVRLLEADKEYRGDPTPRREHLN